MIKKGIRVTLFAKIAIVIVTVLVLISIMTINWTTRAMEEMFIDTFTIANERILDQVVIGFERFNEENIALMNVYRHNSATRELLTGEEEDLDLYSLYYKVRLDLNEAQKGMERFVRDVVIVGENGMVFSGGNQLLNMSEEELINHPMTLNAIEEPTKIKYYYMDEGMYQNSGSSIVAVKQLMHPYSMQTFGTIYVPTKEKELNKIYNHFTEEGNNILILDGQGTIVSSNLRNKVGSIESELIEEVKWLEENEQAYKIKEGENGRNIILSKYLPIFDMYLVNQVDTGIALAPFTDTEKHIRTVYIGTTILTILVIFLITRKITKPLDNLIKHISSNKKGKFVKIREIKGGYEVRELQTVYNHMIEELEVYIESFMEEQKQRKNAELEVLQMQINPHFLYNTLATIKYLCWQGNTEAIERTIHALISLLQNTIHKPDEMLTIREEIENLQNYVIINKERYGDMIDVNYDVDEECEGCEIPKLMLQPFLENAFFHAYQKKKEGIIRVFIRRKQDQLICEIIDDGDGIDERNGGKPSQGAHKKHFSGIGVKNVEQRIKMIYGEQYGVKISSKKGIGTAICINIPYRISKNN